jgi:exonuclease III
MNTLKILLLNIQGLNSSQKLAIFENYLDSLSNPPTILGLCETWLDSFDCKKLNLRNYQLITAYGRNRQSRGGVALLIKKSCDLKWHVIKCKSIESHFETCATKLYIGNRCIHIFLIYRPSNAMNNTAGQIQSFLNLFEDLISKNVSNNEEIIILGDFNINMLHPSSEQVQLSDIVSTYRFKLLNTSEPTRNFNNSISLIDHVYCNFDCAITCLIEDIDFSDHRAVFCDFGIAFKLPKDKWVFIREFSDENWVIFFSFLALENWENIYRADSVSEKSKHFMDLLMSYFNSSFPLKRKIIRGNKFRKVPLSNHTEHVKSELRELGELVSMISDPDLKKSLRKQYNSQKKYLAFCIKSDIRKKNENVIKNSSNKGKAAWKLINQIEGKQQSKKDLNSLTINNQTVTDMSIIANHLNNQFKELSPDLSSRQAFAYPQEMNINQVKFNLQLTSEAEVFSIIESLCPKNSAGWDGISTKVLKKISLLIVTPLTHIINASLLQGTFPDNLKISVITPIYKKGDKSDPANYRPIAITSSVSKVFEKIFLVRLEDHFERHNLLCDNQHGFRKNRSTVTALFDLVTQIYDNVENRKKINLILYDFKNAFGCLVPEILINKLRIYGLDDLALSWISSFLSDRQQYVQLKSFDDNNTETIFKSCTLSCSMGVPQGTILGPFGWNSYSNDFPLHILFAILLIFADDSSALVVGNTYSEVHDKTVIVNDSVIKFANDNFLRLNAQKTNILQIHTHQTKILETPNVYINNSLVETCNEGKLLGIFISDNLSWKKQCDTVVSKLRSAKFLFTMLKDNVPESIIRTVYFSYVQSHILYSIVIWGGSPYMAEITTAQKNVIRAMAGVRFCWNPDSPSSCRPLFKKFNILPAYSLYILECIKFVHKYPEKFVFACDSTDSGRVTRNKKIYPCDLIVKESTLSITSQNPVSMIARIFNHLPLALKMSIKEKKTVKLVKELLYECFFYDKFEYFEHKFD